MTLGGREAPGALADSVRERPAPASDDELVRRTAAADTDAFRALYAERARHIRVVARCIVRDDHDAEEVVVNTFWYVWTNAHRYDPARGSVHTWMSTVARSRAWDCMRRRAREGRRGTALEGYEVDGAPLGPDQAYEATERRDRVRGAIGALPPAQREVMHLAYGVGMSHSEIALSTGLPLGTVKTRVRLATAKLREGLAALR